MSLHSSACYSVNITKCLRLGSNFYWVQWQTVVDKCSVCWSRLAGRLEIAVGYQTAEVIQFVMMQTCENGT
jgi:hypothetical protein